MMNGQPRAGASSFVESHGSHLFCLHVWIKKRNKYIGARPSKLQTMNANIAAKQSRETNSPHTIFIPGHHRPPELQFPPENTKLNSNHSNLLTHMHLSTDFQPKHPKHYCTFIKRPSEIETTQTTCQEEKGEDYEDVIVYFLAVKAATYFFLS